MEKSRTHRKSNLSLQISKKTGILSPTSKSGTGLISKALEQEQPDSICEIFEQYPLEFVLKYELLSIIGKGYQGGVVREVKEKETGLIFAAKIYCTQDEERISLIRNELDIVSKITHKAFPAFKTFIEDPELGYYICITEYCPYISLETFLATASISKSEAKTILSQIDLGLRYLHSQAIIHRDFNPTNILIDPFTFSIKIIDFGLSKILKNLEDDEELDSPEGNPKYRAPHNGDIKNPFFEDIWGLTCIGLSLFFNEEMCSKKMWCVFQDFQRNKTNFMPKHESTEEICEFLERLLLAFK